jgi:biotin synthase
MMLDHDNILSWLREQDPARLEALYAQADAVRRENVGDAVHLRGLIEVSNHCVRRCGYCGLRAEHKALARYRMSFSEVLSAAHDAKDLGYGTVVIQGGEDPVMDEDWISDLVRQIKRETGLAITLSLGEREDGELAAWKAAGADRYLLRFETSDPELYELVHPAHGRRKSGPEAGRLHERISLLRRLRAMGYEIGSGVMVGIPGQTWETLAQDILLFAELDLDMIGVGPYLPHPATPLGRGEWGRAIAPEAQVPAIEEMVYKVVALTRLVCPQANIPSTTALATINKASGRELGLCRGANIVMPNVTPTKYRALYEIYPAKACITETAHQCNGCLTARIESIGRYIGAGPGGRRDHSVSAKATTTRAVTRPTQQPTPRRQLHVL